MILCRCNRCKTEVLVPRSGLERLAEGELPPSSEERRAKQIAFVDMTFSHTLIADLCPTCQDDLLVWVNGGSRG